MTNRSASSLLLLGTLCALLAACSNADEPSSDGTGGSTPATGGTSTTTGGVGTGGANPATGGATGGAAPVTGGAGTTGGTDPGTGGALPGTGGALPGSGGAPPNTGGSLGDSGGTGGEANLGGTGGSLPGLGGQPGDGGYGGAGAAGGASGTVGHPRRVLLCDEGNRRVLLLDLESSDPVVWSTLVNDPTQHGDSLRDLQLVGGDRVAVSTARGYVELDLGTGQIAKTVSDFDGIESLRRLPSGNTVLGANANGGVTLQEVDGQDAPVAGRQVTFTNLAQLRLFRRTPDDTFLLAVGARIAEVNWAGDTLWEMDIPGGDWVFQAVRLSDGNIAATSGYGAAIQIIDPESSTVVTTIGGPSQPDAGSIVPNFYAGFQILANDHFVVTNWEGHGGGHGVTGIQLLEYDPSGQLVWHWQQDPNLVSSLHQVIVLDGLDTSLLHDDVGGVLAPQ